MPAVATLTCWGELFVVGGESLPELRNSVWEVGRSSYRFH